MNVNNLNTSNKRHNLCAGLKNKAQPFVSNCRNNTMYTTHGNVFVKDKHRLRVNGWKNIFQAKRAPK
jgi:hypothetical protein